MKKLTINISDEDYKTLKMLANNSEDLIEIEIREAVKVYICSWIQYIPYIKKHPEWVCPEIFNWYDNQKNE